MVPLIIIPSGSLGKYVLPIPETMGSVALKMLVSTTGHKKHPSVLSAMTPTWNIGLIVFMYQQARKRSNTIGC